jgi:hypothetical protein
MKFRLHSFEKYLILIYLLLLPLWHPWINSDGICYYAQLRSFFIDHDLQYANEFAHYRAVFENKEGTVLNQLADVTPYKPAYIEESIFSPIEEKTPTGHTPNRFSIGPAILWTPFFLIGHGMASISDLFFKTQYSDGYSLFYIIPVTFGTTLYGLLALLLTFRFCCFFFSPRTSFISILGLWFASPLVYYMYLVPSMSHTMAFFAIALFMYFWWKWKEDYSHKHLFLIGIMAGLVSLIRWQDLFILGFPFFDLWLNKEKQIVKKTSFLLIGFGLGCLPQIIIWKIVYGSYLLVPMGNENMNWFSSRIFSVLFSAQHGFILWNPIFLFCLIGLMVLFRKQFFLAGFTLLFFAIEVYINGVPNNWFCGSSFGYRRLLELLPLYCLGLCTLIEQTVQKKTLYAWIGLFIILSLWNIGFMMQFALGKVSHIEPVNFCEVARNQIFWLPGKLGQVMQYLVRRIIP